MSLYQCELVLAALFFPLCMCEFVWSSNPHADTWHCGPHALSGARQPWNHAVFILHTSLAWLKAVCRADSARRLSLFMKTQNFIIYSLMTNANEKYLYVTELLYNVWLLIPGGLRWLRVLSPFSFSLFLASPFCLLGLCKKKKVLLYWCLQGKNTYRSGFISEGKQTREIYVHPQQTGASAAPKKTEKLTTHAVELQLYLFIAPQKSDIHSTSVSFFPLFVSQVFSYK